MNINQKLAFYHLRALRTLKNYWFERREFADWPTFDDFVKHSRKMRFIKVNEENYIKMGYFST
jgi:hypothetical protein